ncbi:hypothetical protein ES703_104507 [subsurface metagenome]
MKQEYRDEFKDLVDRSMIILVLKCDRCGAIVARVVHPKTAKLDKTCDEFDHSQETGHRSYTALKRLFVYMCAADKELANELGEYQRKKFDEFLDSFKNLKP